MNEIATVANPFGSTPKISEGNALANSEAERAIQEVQASMVIAKRFPRDIRTAMDRILNACTRPTLAEGALYCYSRGGSEITGPSIRLAEALAQEWGNMQFGIRELSAAGGSSTVEAFAWDVERNTRQTKVFQVEHVRYTRKAGKTKLTDPRDIYEVIANQGARRLRACILGVIPGDVTEAAVKQCELTQQANIDTSPESIKAMLGFFEKSYGVTQEHIEKWLGRHVQSIQPAQMQRLKNIAQSLKDGMSKPADWFDVDTMEAPVGPQVSDLTAMLGDKAIATHFNHRPKPSVPPPVAPQETIPQELAREHAADLASATMAPVPDTAEDPGPAQSGPITYAELVKTINGKRTLHTLDDMKPIISEWLKVPGNERDHDSIWDVWLLKQDSLRAEHDADPRNQ